MLTDIKNESDVPKLTARQIEVLELAQRGIDAPGIAETLCLTKGTVRNHLNRIHKELDVNTRTGAIYVAQKLGFLAPPGVDLEVFRNLMGLKDHLAEGAKVTIIIEEAK